MKKIIEHVNKTSLISMSSSLLQASWEMLIFSLLQINGKAILSVLWSCSNFLFLFFDVFFALVMGWLLYFQLVWIFMIYCGRDLHVFKEVSVSRAWAGPSHMREQSHGRCWMRKTASIALPSCSSTGLLSEKSFPLIYGQVKGPLKPLILLCFWNRNPTLIVFCF